MTNLLLLLTLVGLIAIFAAILMTRAPRSLRSLETTLRKDLRDAREESRAAAKELREEVAAGMRSTNETLSRTLEGQGTLQHVHQEGMQRQFQNLTDANQAANDALRTTLDRRVKDLQEGNDATLGAIRKEVGEGLKLTADTLERNVKAASGEQKNQLEAMSMEVKGLSEKNQAVLEKNRVSFDARVKELQESNEKKLEEMRCTVDEKLHDTLEKRLGASFKLVSDRLDTVHKGLGEMQGLATGVGDLKRLLTNVKARGTWAEYQLGAILADILTPEQWAKNVGVREGCSERVEYAVRLPGRNNDPSVCMWLPIDSKFPQEDYMRLQAAADVSDQAQVKLAQEALLRTIRAAAKDIHNKYISPPVTTNFAVMYLATEGLYGEALREPGLVQELQDKYRIVVAGPTTLSALLTSLRVGFQTLAIEQRAAEAWKVLGAVKTEFAKFGGVLDKVHRQLQLASGTIEEAGSRTRAMERRLRSVEQLSSAEAATVLALPTMANDAESDATISDVPEVKPEHLPQELLIANSAH